MGWPLLFGSFLLVVVALKYLWPRGQRCPQCQARRADPEHPICPECGWIFEVPGEEDEDYRGEEGPLSPP